MASVPDAGLPAGRLKLERRGPIALLGLDRADKRNALDDAAILALESFFARPPDDVRAVVLYGEGKHFSAGLDLTELSERSASAGIAHSRRWHRAFDAIQFGSVPVVAVLHGAVVGGGLELAAAAHVRVAERSAFYALPEGERGIFVGGGGSVRITRLIGVARVMDMMLTGRTYTAEEGLAIGLSQYVVDGRDAGMAKGIALAERIAGNAPLTNFAILQALPRIAESGQAEGLLTESLMTALAQGDPEAKRRIEAFLSKRAPKVGEA
ncbi:MAG TPA: crotonase/enoyl-CoA hydratase family protein [Candidatus Sulfotelmatobacter sp.]|nr:crotonase/enoyl-CoA hydratase family protein [Candidatus Sulfotelmatobacter sp.]